MIGCELGRYSGIPTAVHDEAVAQDTVHKVKKAMGLYTA